MSKELTNVKSVVSTDEINEMLDEFCDKHEVFVDGFHVVDTEAVACIECMPKFSTKFPRITQWEYNRIYNEIGMLSNHGFSEAAIAAIRNAARRINQQQYDWLSATIKAMVGKPTEKQLSTIENLRRQLGEEVNVESLTFEEASSLIGDMLRRVKMRNEYVAPIEVRNTANEEYFAAVGKPLKKAFFDKMSIEDCKLIHKYFGSCAAEEMQYYGLSADDAELYEKEVEADRLNFADQLYAEIAKKSKVGYAGNER